MSSIVIKLTDKQYEEILYQSFIEIDYQTHETVGDFYKLTFSKDKMSIDASKVEHFIDRLTFYRNNARNGQTDNLEVGVYSMIDGIIRKLKRALNDYNK